MKPRTKPRWTKWGPIVYSASAGGYPGDVRMALYPVLDDEPLGRGERFPCRVVFGWAQDDACCFSSCRGKASKGLDGTANREHDRIDWLLDE